MELKKVTTQRQDYVPLLLLADEDEAVVHSYLHEGDLFELIEAGERIGVALCIEVDGAIELKNIAIDEMHQGRGYGKWLVTQLCRHYSEYERAIVGTANSSISNIAFYQKLGFTLYDVKWHYFTKRYAQPIIEDRIQAQHMLMFERTLIENGNCSSL